MAITTEFISSKANKTVLQVASLKEKKYRELHSSFFVEGWKLLKEAVAASLPIAQIFIAESKKEVFLPMLEDLLLSDVGKKIRVFILSEACVEKISTEKAPQGVITVIKHLDFFKRCIKINKEDFTRENKMLLLSSVRDPSNLGAIIRSAVAFGTDTLILSSDCADLYNPKTVRAAMGNLFKVRAFIVDDAAATVGELRASGRRVFAAEMTERAVPLHIAKPSATDVFVIGNEGHGIGDGLSAACDGSVYIPMRQEVESLNAAVAASVLLWEQSK